MLGPRCLHLLYVAPVEFVDMRDRVMPEHVIAICTQPCCRIGFHWSLWVFNSANAAVQVSGVTYPTQNKKRSKQVRRQLKPFGVRPDVGARPRRTREECPVECRYK